MAKKFTLPKFPSDPVLIDFGDGVDRELRYDMGTMREMAESGISPHEFAGGRLMEIIWWGLQNRDGLEGPAQLERIIPAAANGLLVGALVASVTGSYPKPDEDDPNATGQTA
jgi:hypothetical protein